MGGTVALNGMGVDHIEPRHCLRQHVTKSTDVSWVPAGWLQDAEILVPVFLQELFFVPSNWPPRRVPVCFGTHDGHCDGFRCWCVAHCSFGPILTEFLPARHECDICICTELHAGTTISFQNVKCDVYIRKELRATVALSVDCDIGVKIEGSLKG